MAIEATRIYNRHLELFDEDFQALQQERPLAADLTTVQPVASADESKALNECSGPCLIMAGSGMCTAGRILHHLKQNLWREGTRVLIVGFQPDGSLGRQLVEGAPSVSLFGERVVVRAKVHTLGGFSAHAGQRDLLNWLAPMAAGRPRVILTHGETKARAALADRIAELHGLQCEQPLQGDTLSL
jgi:metallo-beta-lactamase family protein